MSESIPKSYENFIRSIACQKYIPTAKDRIKLNDVDNNFHDPIYAFIRLAIIQYSKYGKNDQNTLYIAKRAATVKALIHLGFAWANLTHFIPKDMRKEVPINKWQYATNAHTRSLEKFNVNNAAERRQQLQTLLDCLFDCYKEACLLLARPNDGTECYYYVKKFKFAYDELKENLF